MRLVTHGTALPGFADLEKRIEWNERRGLLPALGKMNLAQRDKKLETVQGIVVPANEPQERK